MATMTVIVGEPPYGKERVYTALRFSLAALYEKHAVNVFLLEDAVFAAKAGQAPAEIQGLLDGKMPNCEELLKSVISHGGNVRICGVCTSERALEQSELVEGAQISSMRELVQWVAASDRVVSF
jgi:tRNA 2-thiouridine synthesizing protein D